MTATYSQHRRACSSTAGSSSKHLQKRGLYRNPCGHLQSYNPPSYRVLVPRVHRGTKGRHPTTTNHAKPCAGVRLMDRIPIKTIHETLKMPMLEDRLKMLATRFGNKAYSEVAPVSQIIYSHRQLAECKYTPLAKFMDGIDRGPCLQF